MATIRRRIATGAAVMRPAVTTALTRALFAEWARNGYGALSLEAVAKRAGVGKAALYRRWPSKQKMAGDCLGAIGLDLTDWPDTGSLAGDIAALLHDLRRLLRRSLVRRILPDLHAEAGRSRELAIGIDRMQRARRARAAALVHRAVERGELRPGVDVEIAIDLIAAPLYWRTIVSRTDIDDDGLARLGGAVHAALRAL